MGLKKIREKHLKNRRLFKLRVNEPFKTITRKIYELLRRNNGNEKDPWYLLQFEKLKEVWDNEEDEFWNSV
ncbi:MAG: hypothetical protein ACTSRA_09200 [Promethearchaeota archaeon]